MILWLNSISFSWAVQTGTSTLAYCILKYICCTYSTCTKSLLSIILSFNIFDRCVIVKLTKKDDKFLVRITVDFYGVNNRTPEFNFFSFSLTHRQRQRQTCQRVSMLLQTPSSEALSVWPCYRLPVLPVYWKAHWV